MKKRIPTSPDAATPLPNAFDALGLDSIGLPEGPNEVALPTSLKKGKVNLRKETAHRGGKTVLVIYSFEASLTDSYLQELLKQLKNTCGCGGVLKNREIELQGLQIERVRNFLSKEGFKVGGITS